VKNVILLITLIHLCSAVKSADSEAH